MQQNFDFYLDDILFVSDDIFNLSLQQGIFPENLKQSKIIPIYKSGKLDDCNNYRPIALLNSISKILEKIVAINLTNHLENNKILHKNQFGFQRGKSTEQNLLLVTDFISKALNDGEFCIGIFLDLKKAFDVCSHPILLKKLEKSGIKGSTLNWFKSYLSKRSQCVEVGGALSEPRPIDISVLQGSILGPILFLIMINDLPDSSNLTTYLFADDSQGLACGKNLPSLMKSVNIELKKWALWFRANKLKVNMSKTKFIIFHTQGKKINMQNLNILYDDNEPGKDDPSLISTLERVTSYKLVGVYLDEKLTFNQHIDHIKSKLTRSIFCINLI